LDLTALVVITIGTFLVSFFNASLGPTGGAQLAIMAYFLPPQLTIASHAVVLGASSLARALNLRQHIDRNFLIRFIFLSAVGTILAGSIFVNIEDNLLFILIGGFILLNNFIPYKLLIHKKLYSWMDGVVALVTGFLTLFIGATGPIVFTYIAANEKDRKVVIATEAACMCFQHFTKVLVLGIITIEIGLHIFESIIFILAAIAGTKIGTIVLVKLPEDIFRIGFKLVTTVIGLYLIGKGFV
jgi:uncharacterized membrane protein YfcA